MWVDVQEHGGFTGSDVCLSKLLNGVLVYSDPNSRGSFYSAASGGRRVFLSTRDGFNRFDVSFCLMGWIAMSRSRCPETLYLSDSQKLYVWPSFICGTISVCFLKLIFNAQRMC